MTLWAVYRFRRLPDNMQILEGWGLCVNRSYFRSFWWSTSTEETEFKQTLFRKQFCPWEGVETSKKTGSKQTSLQWYELHLYQIGWKTNVCVCILLLLCISMITRCINIATELLRSNLCTVQIIRNPQSS